MKTGPGTAPPSGTWQNGGSFLLNWSTSIDTESAVTYQPLVDNAWRAISLRTGADGRLVDVCESTGTRGMNDNDYLRRTAILGRDDRGGGMTMFFATEMAGL